MEAWKTTQSRVGKVLRTYEIAAYASATKRNETLWFCGPYREGDNLWHQYYHQDAACYFESELEPATETHPTEESQK